MTERPKQDELEHMFGVVEAWVNNLSEHHVGKEIDRGMLKTALEACGANFEIDDKVRGRLGADHYSSSKRRKAVAQIWGDNYDDFVNFSKQYADELKSQGVEVPTLEKSGIDYLGFTALLEELTAYAATGEESYSYADFFIRMSSRALNGHVLYELKSKDKAHRAHIRVDGFNDATYEFVGQEGDVRIGEIPFAPTGLHPQFMKDAWSRMKTWRKPLVASE